MGLPFVKREKQRLEKYQPDSSTLSNFGLQCQAC